MDHYVLDIYLKTTNKVKLNSMFNQNVNLYYSKDKYNLIYYELYKVGLSTLSLVLF